MQKHSRRLQYIAAVTGSLIYTAYGSFAAWSATTLPILQSEDSPAPITADQASWLASINSLTGLVATFTAGYAVDIIGRKKLILSAAAPLLVWWPMVAFANSYEMLMVAMTIGSLSGGLMSSPSTMFLCEIADTELRGTLMMIHTVLMNCGSLFMYCAAPYLSVSTVSFMCTAVPIIFIVTFVWMPESPYFFLLRNRESEAVKSLVRYKGELTPEELRSELDSMYRAIRQKQETKGRLKDLFLVPVHRRTLLIMSGFVLLHLSTGAIAFGTYTTYIFEKSGSGFDADVSSIIVTAVSLVSSISSSFIVERVGRRPLGILGLAGCGVCLTAMGAYFYVDETQGEVPSAFDWVPLTTVIGFNVSFGFASAPAFIMFIGEVFHVSVKSVAITICNTVLAVYSFALKKLFQVVSDSVGAHYSFWAFAAMCALTALYLFLLLPETKGRTFAEISDDMAARLGGAPPSSYNEEPTKAASELPLPTSLVTKPCKTEASAV
ncbi:facilitated trehalose transporter Tret1-like [Schistocerca cancellata]|uniref:facilitated trehalose transporter Tret1-like n=1 Tax=Schistocerca cancellata TaxID=274614 RepID=UPI0021198FB8|nr:facilitated trehalose transporter Tret1-like [Schistocerca cancellata]